MLLHADKPPSEHPLTTSVSRSRGMPARVAPETFWSARLSKLFFCRGSANQGELYTINLTWSIPKGACNYVKSDAARRPR